MNQLDANPAMKIKTFAEPPGRTTVLSEDELGRVLKAIDEIEDEHIRTAFHMLIQTGARKSEVLAAKWDDIDLEDRIWRIPSPKAGKPQVIPLPAEIAAMLTHLSREGDYIIPGRNPGEPRKDLRRPWLKIQTDAEIPHVTMHDIRRTFGLRITRKAGLHIASKLLRHSDIRVTERHYAPLELEELRGALEPGEAAPPSPKEQGRGRTGKVVNLRGRKR